jgi:hypothetical protein
VVSDDEVIILLLSLALAAWVAGRWYWHLATPSLATYPGNWRGWMGAAPVGALAGVLIVLKTASSFDVREAWHYIAFYLVLGAVWIFCAARIMTLFGVSMRDDAIERRNSAAAILILAAMAGQAALYAGGNIGDGPGWWVVIAAALLAGGVWWALWWIVESATGASEEITVGRDVPMAVRLGGYMLASGLICGRGVAGDWVSLANTIAEFRDAWPVLVLTALAIGVERLLRAGTMRKAVGIAVIVAAAYVAFAVLAIAASPPLASNPAFRDAAPGSP